MKRTLCVILIACMALNITGCASMPEKKYLDRMPPEDIKSLQEDVDLNRSMWQLAGFTGGLWLGYGDGKRTDFKSVSFSMATSSLAVLGISTLCNLHTYRKDDPEKNWLFYGMLVGAGAGGAFSTYLVEQNLKHPNEFMLLPVALSPFIIIYSALTGAGLGTAIGKLLPKPEVSY